MKIAEYETDLITDPRWARIKPMLPPIAKRGRPPTDRRCGLKAILYIVKGCTPWRLLPSGFHSWKTVHSTFRKWAMENAWDSINARLRPLIRESEGTRSRPTAAILDSQSVKSDGHSVTVRYDAAKRIKGHKRHLLVDTLGLVLGVLVTGANVPEREGGQVLLGGVLDWCTWLRRTWVDGAYIGKDFERQVQEIRAKVEVDVIKRSDDVAGLKVLPPRWVLERSFG